MCMVSINVDEAALREMKPGIDSAAAVRVWVQELVDARMQQMRAEQGRKVSQPEATGEDLWHAIEQDSELTLKPSVIAADDGEAIDLETFRADLHRMVDEIYAEA